jgi:dTDP-4-dehydrorhamnose reductase
MQAEMEEAVLRHCSSALVIRTGALLHPGGFSTITADKVPNVLAGHSASTVISLTYIPDLVNTCLDLLVDGEHGRWHLANTGTRTWADLVREIASQEGLAATHTAIKEKMQKRHSSLRQSLSYVLKSERGQLLPSLDDALSRYRHEHIA